MPRHRRKGESMMKEISITMYDQNIWGNMAKDQRIANRNGLIKELIWEHEPDVCCFQECNPNTSRMGDTAIEKLIAERYTEVPTSAGVLDYTPVFYRTDRFDVVDSGYHCYAGKNDHNSKSITWAILSEKASGVRFGICSTHFWWKSDTDEDNQQRLQNADVLYDCMMGLRDKYDVPVFATGDLNCGAAASQGNAPYLSLAERLLDARRVATVTNDKFTHHAYPVMDENGIYRNGGVPKRTLDHMFLTEHRNVRVDSFDVDHSQKALDTSDHCPLIVKATIFG